MRMHDAPDPDVDNAEIVSKTVIGHLLEWSDGLQSSAALRRHMRNAVTDGLQQPSVKLLANIGGEASTEQHVHAGLMKILDDIGLTAVITTLADADVTHTVLPSTLIRTLHEHYIHEFRVRLGADTLKLTRFWDMFSSRPKDGSGLRRTRFCRCRMIGQGLSP